MSKMLAIIDATTKADLDKLTRHRMPGALPFAGKYRLIDFALSNIHHAKITNVAIFPQGNYRSLQDHVGSGKRWDLDRRKDGLFILPPKNITAVTDDMITFQRMHEHIEHFYRSTEEYVLIVPANIVWNVNFLDFLALHIESKADITEIITSFHRLKTFIVSKSWLIKQIIEYDMMPFKTMIDIVRGSPSIQVNTYQYNGYVRYIDSVLSYYRSNIDMLNQDISRQIFNSEHPILSKEKTAPPVLYLQEALVENSMIASGARLNGTIINSVISRDVTIGKGAVITDSVIMSNVIIEENAHIEYAILDKGTIVKANTYLVGTKDSPYLTQKEQTLSQMESLRIVHVASECQPFIKTGGLADVIGDLSRHTVNIGVNVSVILPLYSHIKRHFETELHALFSKVINYNNEPYKITIHHMIHRNVDVYFIEHFKFFERESIYGYKDDCERFAFFSYACVNVLDDIGQFDIVHVHDWHSALIPYILKHYHPKPPKTVLTLHNVDYQGVCSIDVLTKMNLPVLHALAEEINMLETGIKYATLLTTVSPTYRDELRLETIGKNLTGALLSRERDFYGVLNGLSNSYNPQSDSLISAQYHPENLARKLLNKTFLQSEMKLRKDAEAFLIGSVGRITEQKGFDLILPVIEYYVANEPNIQFVLLGTGESRYVDRLENLAKKYPQQVAVNIGYDATIPNYIYAGSDLFIMPSRVEPCGLSQMIAMRYGTIPLVRKTGGLADTVINYDTLTQEGTGFSFYNYSVDALTRKLQEAHLLFTENKNAWTAMMKRAMCVDFSLEKQAVKMLELYKIVLNRRTL